MTLREKSVVASKGGPIEFVFRQVPVDRVWTGSVSIPGAGSNNAWTVAFGSFEFTFNGAGPYGPVQLFAGEQLVISGMSPGVLSLVANLFGSDDAAFDRLPYYGPFSLSI